MLSKFDGSIGVVSLATMAKEGVHSKLWVEERVYASLGTGENILVGASCAGNEL